MSKRSGTDIASLGHEAFESMIRHRKDGARFCFRPSQERQPEKSFDKSAYRIALMSLAPHDVFQFSIGMDIIFDSLERDRDIFVDQCTWYSMKMRNELGPNTGYLSKQLVSDFDMIGIGIYYVASYFLLTQSLMSIGIHPLAARRKESDPLIVGGGRALSSNPEPVAEFFDFIVVGEGESVFPDIIKCRRNGQSKSAYLQEINEKFDCVYVPSIPGKIVHRRQEDVIKPLTASNFTSKPTNKTIEIIRGCDYKCNFCELGWSRKNATYADVDDVVSAINSYPDGSRIYPFAPDESSYGHDRYSKIINAMGNKRLSRYNQRVNTFADMISSGNCARPETDNERARIVHGLDGISDRCRKWVNKRITNEQINTVTKYDLANYLSIKLNVVYALPFENHNDWHEWDLFLTQLCEDRRRITPQNMWLTDDELKMRCVGEQWDRIRIEKEKLQMIHIAPTMFQPEPSTPMQWFQSCANQDSINRMFSICKKTTTKYGMLKIEGQESVQTSHAVVALKRGGRWMTPILLRMGIDGTMSWSAASKRFINILTKIGKYPKIVEEIDTSEKLPWDFIENGIKKSTLEKIFHNMKSDMNQ